MTALLPKKQWLLVMAVLLTALLVFIFSTRRQAVDFNAEVKPIFNKKCILCHGGVRRKANFSLLFRDDALNAKTESGKRAIIPGDPEHSEMIRRLTLKDPEERMPYRHDHLSGDEIAILKRWIKEGAQWGNHWAYVAVQPVAVPQPKSSFFGLTASSKLDWAKNDIDYFIYDKFRDQGLRPSPEASKADLLRRVSLDLTGIPPPPNIGRQFLDSHSPNAYEVLVDSLLASPHFGERWAALWLDLARYADTKGYERDDSRTIWRYRDWLIRAFNADEPYNQFITDQIAGDLLPNPSDAQLIATAFNRNTMTNDEGGTENEEFRTAAVLDRVNTTWEALMGTTFACVQCHSHPYDPFTHDEYYQFMAFFNNTRDEDTYADYPLLRQYSPGDSSALNLVTQWVSQNGSAQRAGETYAFLKTWQPAINSINADQFVNCELQDTKWLIFRNHAQARLKKVDLNQKDLLLFRYEGWVKAGVWTIRLDRPDGPLLKKIRIDTTKGGDWRIAQIGLPEIKGVHDLFFSYTNPNLKKPDDSGMQFDWFYFTQALPGKGKPGFDDIEKTYWRLIDTEVPTTPIMMDNPADMHRTSNVFERGNWLVKGKEVTPDVPHALNPLPVEAPHNRMGLAMWMTSKKNPLTSRTIVNRLWEQVFGVGLVETLEDMGTQGAPPSHQELLDWLSWKLMNDYGWSLKKLLKEMVLSATYRQDSKLSAVTLEKDPFNKFYARGARVRLSAEQLHDQALSVSGLLSEKMYGPSVMPFQPGGIWLSPWNGQDWKESNGEDRYRRGLYTYWKRTAPYPTMMTFDGVAREVCTARRIRTNTPLQALASLNDEFYMDAARHLAYLMEDLGGKNIRIQIAKGYEHAMFKPITEAKLVIMEKLYNQSLAEFQKDGDKTCEMIGVMDKHNNPETAALVVVANALLNLDEWITKN
jgi:hypothetical protein